MAGNPDNASLWAEADVYVAPIGTTLPTDGTAAWPAAWKPVGLLSGDDGFTTTRDEDTSDLYAWGGILVRTSRRNFKLTKSFSALEDNAATRSLIWPGSPAGSIVVPKPTFLLIGFETREPGMAKTHRLISKYRAQVDVDGDIVENETDLTKYELVATIFPDASGVLFVEFTTPEPVAAFSADLLELQPDLTEPEDAPPANPEEQPVAPQAAQAAVPDEQVLEDQPVG